MREHGLPHAYAAAEGEGLFLSILPPTRRERLAVLIVGLLCLVGFAAAVPFASKPLPPVPAFIAVYQSALIVTDCITALLLFGQFVMLRSLALLVLAAGYLFAALIAGVHMLTFPGLFAVSGLLGATAQSTAWLYMFWHAGFPITVIAYALLKQRRSDDHGDAGTAVVSIAVAVLGVLAALSVFSALAIFATDWLPPIMQGNGYTPAMTAVIASTWMVSIAAVVVLWWRRPYTVLDLWLIVVMSAWVFDIALSAVFNAGRFDLGFYLGRVSGLLAASFILVVLLTEMLRLYRQLVLSNDFLRDIANRDGLTGILNRRSMDARLRSAFSRAQRIRQPVSFLMIDIDYFKQFNDTYGHLDGDMCLREVAGIIASSMRRPGDAAARFGGEEFAAILPNTNSIGATQVAESIRSSVMAAAIPHSFSATGVVTVSVGVATVAPNLASDVNDVILPADKALYRAKSDGRNRVAAYAARSVGAALS